MIKCKTFTTLCMGTVPPSNGKIAERGKIDNPITCIHDSAVS